MNDLVEKHSELSALETKPLRLLSIGLFNKRTNKTTKLIENEDPANYVKGQNREFTFDFKQPVYVKAIRVHTSDYTNYDKAEFKWVSIKSQETRKDSGKNSEDTFVTFVNDVITSFSFKPDKKYLKQPLITKVSVVGLSLWEFDKFLEDLGQIDEYKAEILDECKSRIDQATSAEEKLNHIQAEEQHVSEKIAELEDQKGGIESEISILKEDKSELLDLIAHKTAEENDLKLRLSQVDDSLDSKTKESQALNQEIVDHHRELDRLKNDINLFPTEIHGFVSQKASSISRYMLLAFLPIAVLVYVTWYLFDNAAEFANIYNNAPDKDIWAIFLSRLPFVTVSLAVISACYKIASIFIAEVIKINSQRLNLSKISIIAKDVSESSENGLELDDEQRYELRTKIKMDLLRSHLKGYIEEGYTYKIDPTLYEHPSRDKHTMKQLDESEQ